MTDEVESGVVFVIRIRGYSVFFNFKSFIRIANLADDVTKILNSLRLKEVNSGVFLKMDRKLQVTLKKIDPYVAYG